MQNRFNLNNPQKSLFVTQYVHDILYYRFNWHREFELNITLKGSADFSVNGDIYHLEEGDILLINPNEGHASLSDSPESISMVIHFNPSFFFQEYPNYSSLKFRRRIVHRSQSPHLSATIGQTAGKMLMALSGDCTYSSRLAAEGHFTLLSALLIDKFSPYTEDNSLLKNRTQMTNIKTILEYIETNYNSKISLNDIADLCNYNRTYVSSFFKDNIGINFYDYLTRVRFRHAIHELLTTDKPLTHIAVDNGFPDLKTFNSKFMFFFHMTPASYRANVNRAQIYPAENHRNYLPITHPAVNEKIRVLLEYTPHGENKLLV